MIKILFSFLQRLQVHVQRSAGDRVVRTKLLLPVRQRRIHPRVRRRQRGRARGQTLRGRPRHQEGHSLKDDHALLPLGEETEEVRLDDLLLDGNVPPLPHSVNDEEVSGVAGQAELECERSRFRSELTVKARDEFSDHGAFLITCGANPYPL